MTGQQPLGPDQLQATHQRIPAVFALYVRPAHQTFAAMSVFTTQFFELFFVWIMMCWCQAIHQSMREPGGFEGSPHFIFRLLGRTTRLSDQLRICQLSNSEIQFAVLHGAINGTWTAQFKVEFG